MSSRANSSYIYFFPNSEKIPQIIRKMPIVQAKIAGKTMIMMPAIIAITPTMAPENFISFLLINYGKLYIAYW